MPDDTNTARPSIAPGEVLELHAWSVRGPALVGEPGGAIRRHPCILRACTAVDGATSSVSGAIASGEGEAEPRLDPGDLGRVDVRFGGARHPVRRVAPPSHGRTSAERLAADLGWTRRVAAETGTPHLHHEGAWGGTDGVTAPRGVGE